MNKLNESLLKFASQGLIGDDDVEGLAVNPDYHQAMVDAKNLSKELEDKFKEQEKDKEAFIKDNQKTDKKPKGTKEMKKMKLSESLFESASDDFDEWRIRIKDFIIEEINNKFDNAAMWISESLPGYDAEWCNEEGNNESARDCQQALEKYADEMALNLLYHYPQNYEESLTTKQKVNEDQDISQYIVIKSDGSTAGVPCNTYEEARELSNNHEGSKIFELKPHKELEEATATLEKPAFYYKKKRQPLADIILRDLTSGEVVYKESQPGKFIATHAPSLNLDEDNGDIGAGRDSNGEYIIAWVKTENDLDDVKEIADRYGKEFKSGFDKYVAGDSKYFGKIYIDETEWDEPYFDPNVPIRPSKGSVA